MKHVLYREWKSLLVGLNIMHVRGYLNLFSEFLIVDLHVFVFVHLDLSEGINFDDKTIVKIKGTSTSLSTFFPHKATSVITTK